MRRLLWAVAVLVVAARVAPAAWTVAKSDDGVWWLVAPEGRRVYSRGVNIVDRGERRKSDHPGFHWQDHFATVDDWRRVTRDDLLHWGFNTRGAWSDPSPVLGLPYTVELDLGRTAQLHWFDPFAPDAAAKTLAVARRLTAPYRDDPLLLGYFTDNEVGWWNSPLFRWYLKAGWENHTKRVLWRLLVEHYHGRWAALRADWVPQAHAGGFDDLKRAGAALKLRPGGNGIHLVDRFTYVMARHYYRLVHDALHTAHPGALVLGDRLPLYYNQDAVRALRGQVDVLSTNYNVDTPDGWVAPYYFEGLRRLADVPVLVSEFFFAANQNRSGNRNNGHLMTVETQSERSAGAAAAMRCFARFPNVVGAHWFQLHDEPSGGRADGEDYNMGLIDIAGRPYEGLVDAFAQVNPQLDALHRLATPRPGPLHDSVVVPIARARTPIRLDDRSLTDWNKPHTLLPGFHAPPPDVPFADVHLAWTPEGLYLALLGSNYLDFDLLADPDHFPLSETFQLHLVVDAGHGLRHLAIHLTPRRSRKYPERLEIEPELRRYARGRPVERLALAGRVQQLDKPLPHLGLEAFVPAGELGCNRLGVGERLRMNVTVVGYYRERTMTWAGKPGTSGTLRTVVLTDSDEALASGISSATAPER
jgi:hypothetical protein